MFQLTQTVMCFTVAFRTNMSTSSADLRCTGKMQLLTELHLEGRYWFPAANQQPEPQLFQHSSTVRSYIH